MQYMIFLTDGKEEHCCYICGNIDSGKKMTHVFEDAAKRDVAWYELREYENAHTQDYVVIPT